MSHYQYDAGVGAPPEQRMDDDERDSVESTSYTEELHDDADPSAPLLGGSTGPPGTPGCRLACDSLEDCFRLQLCCYRFECAGWDLACQVFPCYWGPGLSNCKFDAAIPKCLNIRLCCLIEGCTQFEWVVQWWCIRCTC